MIIFLTGIIALPLIQGLGFARLKRNGGTVSLTECYMMGLLFLFALAEAVSCAAIKLEWRFSEYCRILGSLALICGALSLLINRKEAAALWRSAKDRFLHLGGPQEDMGKRYAGEALFLAALVGLEIASYFVYVPETGNDTMAETVSVTLLTDTVFAYNPLTGGALRYGMYPVCKLASLPLLYAAVQKACGMELLRLLFYALPIWTLLLSFAVMKLWSGFFFSQHRESGLAFLIFLQLLLLTGGGTKTSYAYDLLHGGWKGTTLAAAVVVPFGVYSVSRMIRDKEWLYGAAGGLLSVCGLLFTRPIFVPGHFAFTGNAAGREWEIFALSALALYLVRERIRKPWKKSEAVLIFCCLAAGLVLRGAFCTAGTACALAAVWSVAKEWKRGTAAAVGLAILIFLTGTILPSFADCLPVWNAPQEEKEILDKIEALAESRESVMLAAPDGIMEKARILDGKILLPYGKDLWYSDCNREIADVYTEEEMLLYRQMQTDREQPDAAAAVAADMGCDALVLRGGMGEETQSRYGWRREGETSSYILYSR